MRRGWARAAPACASSAVLCLDEGTRRGIERLGAPDGGKRKGQSVSSDPANKGCILDVGLLVGGRMVLFLAARAGDGIPRPAARAGEPANACLGIGRLANHPDALFFPDSRQ